MDIRLIDTGIKGQSYNICMDRALIDLRKEDKIPDTFRFLGFEPSALVGYHQAVSSEIREDYCRDNGIEIGRRITGGGAIYFDTMQLGWEIVFSSGNIKVSTLENLSEKICTAFAAGLGKMGVDARYRARNDIEVDGKKISGTGGIYESNVYFFQGTLLLDLNPEHLVKSLKIPVEKLISKNFDSILSRVTSLKSIMGQVPPITEIKKSIISGFKECLGMDFYKSDLSDHEINYINRNIDFYSSPEWIKINEFDPVKTRMISEIHKCRGGLFRGYARVDAKRETLKQVYLTGDYFVSPLRTVSDMETFLKDTRFEEIKSKIDEFFELYKPQFQNIDKNDFFKLFEKLFEKTRLSKFLFLDEEDMSRFILINGMTSEDIPDVEYLLLPYCGKKAGCEFRTSDGCSACGECETGTAYKFAEKYNIKPKTVINYENLVETLDELKKKRIKSYIGFCCKEFYIKRSSAFEESGIKALLIDISSPLCYDLRKEKEAYEGKFKGETLLGTEILKNFEDHMKKKIN